MLQLNSDAIEYASAIIDRASRQVVAIANTTNQLDTSIVVMAIEGTANILTAVSKVGTLTTEGAFTTTTTTSTPTEAYSATESTMNESAIREVVEKSQEAIHSLMKVSLRSFKI